MNRKWLAVFTLCIAGLGFSLLHAQSSQPQAPGVSPAQAGWGAAEPFEVFTSPVDVTTAPGLPVPDGAGAPGDVFFLSTGPDANFFALSGSAEGPEFTTALPAPDPQGGTTAGIPFVGPLPKDTITFVNFQGGLGNQVVTGAPYSATVTSEFQQTLADGNKIDRKTVTTVYRDSQGRTRREQTLPAIGQYSASTPPQVIFINDPVAGANYVLNPTTMTAQKMPGGPGRGGMPLGPGPGGPGRGGPGGPGRGPGGNAGPKPDPNVATESLGGQNIEKIFAQGTRVTRTIPAGSVGNQNPIHVTSERWYSPDLKIDVMVKNDNPTGGQNSTTLSNINTSEPDPTLFQVPSGYTIQDPPKGPAFRGRRGGPPPPPPSAPAQ